MEVNSTISALNERAGFNTASFSHPSLNQEAALEHLFEVHLRSKTSVVSAEATKEAVTELLGNAQSYGGEGMTTVRSYERSLLSIPQIGAEPVPLNTVLPPEARHFLVDVNSMLKGPQEWGAACESQKFVNS